MKKLLLLLSFLLSGCGTTFTAYVQSHAATIGAVGLVAGTVSQVESAALNAEAIVEKVK